MSNTLSGREAARLHRSGQKSGKTSSSPTRPTANVASKPAPIAPKATPAPVAKSTAPSRRPAPTGAPVASVGGRDAARKHRQGQKTGKSQATPTRPTANIASKAAAPAPIATTASAAAPAPAPAPVRRQVAPIAAPVAVAGGREAAKQARAQQKTGKVNRTQGTPNPHPKAKARSKDQEPIVEARERTENISSAPARTDRKVKANAKPVVSSGGRNASKAFRKAGSRGKAAQAALKAQGTSSGAVAKMSNPDASTREIAQKIRAERCTKGKQGCASAKSAGAIRQAKRNSAGNPEKVGETTTLSGQSVTGTQVGQGRKVMTGAETGACQLVSGTEYLGSEEFAGSCDTQPSAQPAKVTQTATTRGQVVSGTGVGSKENMTGDRAGQCSAVTGTEYIPADQAEILCGSDVSTKPATNAFSIMSQPSQAKKSSGVTGGENYKSNSTTIRPSNPAKVVTSMTAMGNATTGTQVGRQADVTGAEKGSCKNVSGTGYRSAEESAACGVTEESVATKVTTSATTAGQVITGDRSGDTAGMTGAEAGSCKAVTGTGYMGAEQVKSCSTDAQTEIMQRQRQNVNHAVTGVQPGPQGLTGAQKGACSLVSGTHYLGNDQVSMVCDSSNASMPGEADFPNLIGAQPAMQAPQQQVTTTEEQNGSRITGDGWDRSSKVTGTEGPWASQRNSSIRGASGQAPMGAAQFRPVAMEEVPQSPITGSSGNTDTGAKVTLSGGARA